MNVLEVINKVMVRLREPTATTINESPFAKVVAQFVDQAHREVGDAHPWSEFRQLIDVNVSQGEKTIGLFGTTKRTRVQYAYNVTENGSPLHHQSREWIMRQRVIDDQQALPCYWAGNGYTAVGLAQIELWASPDASYTLRFDVINPDTDLLTGDVGSDIRIPIEPIILRAQAMALAERGDDGGTTYPLVMQEYQIALNDAIQRDKDNHSVYDSDDSWRVP